MLPVQEHHELVHSSGLAVRDRLLPELDGAHVIDAIAVGHYVVVLENESDCQREWEA